MASVFTQTQRYHHNTANQLAKTPSTFKLINEKIVIAACKRQPNSH